MNSIKIQKIGITDLDTDAIVNAANDDLCLEWRKQQGVSDALWRIPQVA